MHSVDTLQSTIPNSTNDSNGNLRLLRGERGRILGYQGNKKMIAGKLHRLCTGPSHDEPTWLPATDKYFYSYKTGHRKGLQVSRCRLCLNWSKLKVRGGEHGWVSIKDAWPIIDEAVTRIGLMELARRSGVSESTIGPAWHRQNTYIQKAKLRAIMLELISAKRKKERPINNQSRAQHMRRLHRREETCVGCGMPWDQYTPGCYPCSDRKAKRKKRGLAGTGEKT